MITTFDSVLISQFCYSYAGPGSQSTKAEWKHGWSSYMAGSRGWIVALIDGRGSGGDGETRQKELWKRLGSVEVQDQITIANYLAKELPIIDLRRIAIWGWSYGGYASLKALGDKDQNIFQCAIAVAPVTNWKYYGITHVAVFNKIVIIIMSFFFIPYRFCIQ